MRALIVSNPNATGQRPEVIRQITPHLMAVPGMELKVAFTHYPGHATELCRGLHRDDFDVIIALGGDGTLNEVINGIFADVPEGHDPDPQQFPALALVPTGSANVFARALGYPQSAGESARLLARLLRDDQRRTIYLGRWNQKWFAVNCGFGIDADVIARMERARSRGFSATPLRYLTTSLIAWRRTQLEPPQIEVEATTFAGDQVRLRDVPLVFASNTNPWTFLGPLPVVTNPKNSFDRGFGVFSLTRANGIGGVAAMLHLIGMGHSRWFERYLRRRTVQIDDAQTLRMRTPRRNFQVDGELVGKFDEVNLRTVKDCVEVFAPKEESRWEVRTLGQAVRDFLRLN